MFSFSHISGNTRRKEDSSFAVYEGKLSISKYFLSKLLIAAAPFRDSRKIKRKKEKRKNEKS